MPLGIVEDSIFDAELGDIPPPRPNPQARVVVDEKGRGNNPEVPEGLRQIIGENALEEGSKATKELTQALDISDSSLSAYKQGAHSTSSYNQPSKNLSSFLGRTKKRIARQASEKVFAALDRITDQKLDNEDARNLTAIARDMSAIIKNMEPEPEKVHGNTNVNATFVLHAPMLLKEERFEVIQANES